MTITSKFKKDINTLKCAVNGDFFLDVKNPKLYKKLKRYYVSEGLELTGEDPDFDYANVIECVRQDLESTPINN